jgi:ABC-type oligopeptide transport system ATPase subunit
MNLLEVKGLSKQYRKTKRSPFDKTEYFTAVHPVKFHIASGETFGLVGESGSGKSTIANMIAGIIRPTSGEAFLDGVNIRDKERAREVGREIQMVFQNPYASLNPVKRIGWQLEEPLRVHRIGTKKTRKQEVIKMLEIVGMDESYLRRYPHELSGGQRQRVVILIALILRPKLVILDEPVSSLDVSVQAQILNLLKDLQKTFDVAYLFISHDLQVVEYMSDRIGVLKNGHMVEMAPTSIIVHQPIHPYTQTLMTSVPGMEDQKAKLIKPEAYRSICSDQSGIFQVNPDHFVLCEVPSR